MTDTTLRPPPAAWPHTVPAVGAHAAPPPYEDFSLSQQRRLALQNATTPIYDRLVAEWGERAAEPEPEPAGEPAPESEPAPAGEPAPDPAPEPGPEPEPEPETAPAGETAAKPAPRKNATRTRTRKRTAQSAP